MSLPLPTASTRRVLIASLVATPLLSVIGLAIEAEAKKKKGKKKRKKGTDYLAILRRPPFAPTDISLFTPQVYGAPATAPASDGPSSEAELRALLEQLLARRFGTSTSGKNRTAQALTIFDAEATKAIMPDPRLRAALASLTGTFAEAAIAGVVDGLYGSVAFGPVPGDTNPTVAYVEAPTSEGDTPDIVFNDRYQHEDFRVLSNTMAHEPLHRDPANSQKEELINNAIDTLVYGWFVLETPALATSGTELVRRYNTKLMARLNSRDPQGQLRVFEPDGGNVYPGSDLPLENFGAAFSLGGEPGTPGNATLVQMLRQVTGQNVPDDADFDDASINLLDEHQVVFSPAEIVKLCQILKLNLNTPAIESESNPGGRGRNPSAAELWGGE